jgi:hypothetical protein
MVRAYGELAPTCSQIRSEMTKTRDVTEAKRPWPSPYVQVGGLVAGEALIALGNGLMATFVPVRLDQAGLGQCNVGLLETRRRACADQNAFVRAYLPEPMRCAAVEVIGISWTQHLAFRTDSYLDPA